MSGYRRPQEFGAVCQHETLARTCEVCDHLEEIADLTARLSAAEESLRIKEQLNEALRQREANQPTAQDIEDRDRAIESLRLKVDTAHGQIDALKARAERLAAECRAWRAFDAVNCCDWDITAEMRKTYPETTKARAAVDAAGDLETRG